jgi:hypothetical protein
VQRFHEARRQIQVSDSREGVSLAIQTLLDQLMPSELAHLPPVATAALRTEAELIPASALELTRAELAYTGDGESGTLLRDIALAYVLASNRIASLDSKAKLYEKP